MLSYTELYNTIQRMSLFLI